MFRAPFFLYALAALSTASCAPAPTTLAAPTDAPAASPLPAPAAHVAVMASKWYLPPHFARLQDDLIVVGSGAPLGQLYAHSDPLPVTPGGTYRTSVTIDARYTSGKVCFYLAAQPAGQDLGIACAVNGKVGRYAIASRIPLNITTVEWVAYINGSTVEADKVVAYRKLALDLVRAPVSTSKDLLSS